MGRETAHIVKPKYKDPSRRRFKGWENGSVSAVLSVKPERPEFCLNICVKRCTSDTHGCQHQKRSMPATHRPKSGKAQVPLRYPASKRKVDRRIGT